MKKIQDILQFFGNSKENNNSQQEPCTVTKKDMLL